MDIGANNAQQGGNYAYTNNPNAEAQQAQQTTNAQVHKDMVITIHLSDNYSNDQGYTGDVDSVALPGAALSGALESFTEWLNDFLVLKAFEGVISPDRTEIQPNILSTGNPTLDEFLQIIGQVKILMDAIEELTADSDAKSVREVIAARLDEIGEGLDLEKLMDLREDLADARPGSNKHAEIMAEILSMYGVNVDMNDRGDRPQLKRTLRELDEAGVSPMMQIIMLKTASSGGELDQERMEALEAAAIEAQQAAQFRMCNQPDQETVNKALLVAAMSIGRADPANNNTAYAAVNIVDDMVTSSQYNRTAFILFGGSPNWMNNADINQDDLRAAEEITALVKGGEYNPALMVAIGLTYEPGELDDLVALMEFLSAEDGEALTSPMPMQALLAMLIMLLLGGDAADLTSLPHQSA